MGADLGLRLKGPAARRRRRILDAEPHRNDQTLSDISGLDIEAHGNGTTRLIEAVRDWLNAGRGGGDPLPGSGAIVDDYAAFQALLPDIIARLRLDDFDVLPHTDYVHLIAEGGHLYGAVQSSGLEGDVSQGCRE
ncbi:hypothetical protein [uncultured Phenylobacterium sp.]|uniref:hypothetical protein n=1 Tax=uncultured Phenylobacterium sp. TaxID=349273 RepID=UPI0025D2387C|nr:hypothetical protein [uncultured Phenylobacterium sp.]